MCGDLKKLELAAREALASVYGHDLSDEEWAEAMRALLEFGKLSRDWTAKENTSIDPQD